MKFDPMTDSYKIRNPSYSAPDMMPHLLHPDIVLICNDKRLSYHSDILSSIFPVVKQFVQTTRQCGCSQLQPSSAEMFLTLDEVDSNVVTEVMDSIYLEKTVVFSKDKMVEINSFLTMLGVDQKLITVEKLSDSMRIDNSSINPIKPSNIKGDPSYNKDDSMTVGPPLINPTEKDFDIKDIQKPAEKSFGIKDFNAIDKPTEKSFGIKDFKPPKPVILDEDSWDTPPIKASEEETKPKRKVDQDEETTKKIKFDAGFDDEVAQELPAISNPAGDQLENMQKVFPQVKVTSINEESTDKHTTVEEPKKEILPDETTGTVKLTMSKESLGKAPTKVASELPKEQSIKVEQPKEDLLKREPALESFVPALESFVTIKPSKESSFPKSEPTLESLLKIKSKKESLLKSEPTLEPLLKSKSTKESLPKNEPTLESLLKIKSIKESLPVQPDPIVNCPVDDCTASSTLQLKTRSEMLLHLTQVHYSDKLLEIVPFNKGIPCSLCVEQRRPKVLVAQMKGRHVAHIGVNHELVLKFLTDKDKEALAQLPKRGAKKESSSSTGPVVEPTPLPSEPVVAPKPEPADTEVVIKDDATPTGFIKEEPMDVPSEETILPVSDPMAPYNQQPPINNDPSQYPAYPNYYPYPNQYYPEYPTTSTTQTAEYPNASSSILAPLSLSELDMMTTVPPLPDFSSTPAYYNSGYPPYNYNYSATEFPSYPQTTLPEIKPEPVDLGYENPINNQYQDHASEVSVLQEQTHQYQHNSPPVQEPRSSVEPVKDVKDKKSIIPENTKESFSPITCTLCTSHRTFDKHEGLLFHLTIAHFSRDLIKRHPFRDGKACSLCPQEVPFYPTSTSSHISHLGVFHKMVETLLPKTEVKQSNNETSNTETNKETNSKQSVNLETKANTRDLGIKANTIKSIKDEVKDLDEVQCTLCTPMGRVRMFSKRSEMLKHLALLHFGRQLLKSHPFSNTACHLCLSQSGRSFVPSKKEVWVCHVGVAHAKLFDLLPRTVLETVKMMPNIRKPVEQPTNEPVKSLSVPAFSPIRPIKMDMSKMVNEKSNVIYNNLEVFEPKDNLGKSREQFQNNTSDVKIGGNNESESRVDKVDFKSNVEYIRVKKEQNITENGQLTDSAIMNDSVTSVTDDSSLNDSVVITRCDIKPTQPQTIIYANSGQDDGIKPTLTNLSYGKPLPKLIKEEVVTLEEANEIPNEIKALPLRFNEDHKTMLEVEDNDQIEVVFTKPAIGMPKGKRYEKPERDMKKVIKLEAQLKKEVKTPRKNVLEFVESKVENKSEMEFVEPKTDGRDGGFKIMGDHKTPRKTSQNVQDIEFRKLEPELQKEESDFKMPDADGIRRVTRSSLKDSAPIRSSPRLTTSAPTPYDCRYCPGRFTGAKELKEHLLSHRNQFSQINQTPRKINNQQLVNLRMGTPRK